MACQVVGCNTTAPAASRSISRLGLCRLPVRMIPSLTGNPTGLRPIRTFGFSANGGPQSLCCSASASCHPGPSLSSQSCKNSIPSAHSKTPESSIDTRPEGPLRKIPRDIHEHARDVARSLAGTKGFETSRRERKKIEMRFAHLKRILKLGRLRLRGPRGAQDEFVLAAIAQNLRRLATLVARPPPAQVPCIA
jgi:hypothetical protein